MENDWDGEIQGFLQRLIAGDETAAQALVEAFEPEIRIIARRQLGNPLRPYLDSMDIVQSVHRILLQGVAEGKLEFVNRKSLMGFIVTVVRRKAAAHWRKNRRQQRESGIADAMPVDQRIVSLDHCGDPDAAAMYQEQINKTLQSLEGVDRQLIELRLDGYTTAEVAKLLNADADQLRVRLSRLRKKLKAQSWWDLVQDA